MAYPRRQLVSDEEPGFFHPKPGQNQDTHEFLQVAPVDAQVGKCRLRS